MSESCLVRHTLTHIRTYRGCCQTIKERQLGTLISVQRKGLFPTNVVYECVCVSPALRKGAKATRRWWPQSIVAVHCRRTHTYTHTTCITVHVVCAQVRHMHVATSKFILTALTSHFARDNFLRWAPRFSVGASPQMTTTLKLFRLYATLLPHHYIYTFVDVPSLYLHTNLTLCICISDPSKYLN